MNRNVKLSLIIGIVGTISILFGVTYAFFNYTRVGSMNNIGTGRIYFNSTQNGAINMTNVFPITSEEALTANLDSVTVDIIGDTTYEEGEEYLISLTGVNNTINGKKIPISYIASVNNVGSNSSTYWDSRGGDSSIYTLNAEGNVYNDKQILAGYITNGNSGINGSIEIKAYIDADRIAISDTYDGSENDNNGTTSEWVDGRVVFTTEEWNSIASNPLSFKIKVESNEGIWVEKYTTPDECFLTDFLTTNYIINPNLTEDIINSCISILSSNIDVNSLSDGETLENVCSNTGTIYGLSFLEWVHFKASTSIKSSLEMENVILSKGFKTSILDYNPSCGSDVVIPKTMERKLSLETINYDMTQEELDTCVNFLNDYWDFSNKPLLEGENLEDFCMGNGKAYGTYLNDYITNSNQESYIPESFDIYAYNYLLDHNIIMSYPTVAEVTEIGEYAFKGMGITSVELSNSLLRIGNHAFHGNNLKNINIPSNILELGGEAFTNNNIKKAVVSDTYFEKMVQSGACKSGTVTNIKVVFDNTNIFDNDVQVINQSGTRQCLASYSSFSDHIGRE